MPAAALFPLGSTAAEQLPAEETLVTQVREGAGAGNSEREEEQLLATLQSPFDSRSATRLHNAKL